MSTTNHINQKRPISESDLTGWFFDVKTVKSLPSCTSARVETGSNASDFCDAQEDGRRAVTTAKTVERYMTNEYRKTAGRILSIGSES